MSQFFIAIQYKSTAGQITEREKNNPMVLKKGGAGGAIINADIP